MRGQPDRALAVLRRIRGTDADVDAEFKDIIHAVDLARKHDEGAFRRLFSKEYRHYLVIGVAIPVFYEFTGNIIITMFSPVLFRTVGFNSQRAILGSVINSATNLVSTLLFSYIMDRTGRKFLFIIGDLGMLFCQVSILVLLALNHKGINYAIMSASSECVTVDFIDLIFLRDIRWLFHGSWRITSGSTVGFGLSWALLRWVVPSEIYPVEVRVRGAAGRPVRGRAAIGHDMDGARAETTCCSSDLTSPAGLQQPLAKLSLGGVTQMESFLSKFFPEVLRGTKKAKDADIDAEFKDIVSAVNEARQNDKGAFRRLFSKEYRHYLAIGVAIPVFFEFTGMIVIAIFSPLLFRTVGFNSQKAILGSVFLALLCAMKYAVLLFYAGCLLVMTIFVTVFLPETKGVPLEAMQSVWAEHWYWRRFAKDANELDNEDSCLS
ncbi:hypothetical protein HU200_006614 [Digitaria exilis]|uniref:Uncharacterized protein n=1 Tax=Digitaria exilis TaxID=1010633 RepID=A0A835FR01_9POAL|nr:hypothetical protein HU200_006614 [Digitaria exilis]